MKLFKSSTALSLTDLVIPHFLVPESSLAIHQMCLLRIMALVTALQLSGCTFDLFSSNPEVSEQAQPLGQGKDCLSVSSREIFSDACREAGIRFALTATMDPETQVHYTNLSELFMAHATFPDQKLVLSAQDQFYATCLGYGRAFGSVQEGLSVLRAIVVASRLPHVPLSVQLKASSAFARMAHSAAPLPRALVDQFLRLLQGIEEPEHPRGWALAEMAFENIRTFVDLIGR